MFLPDRFMLGYRNGSPLWTHITYILIHASPWHLAVNSLAFTSAWRILSRLNILPRTLTLSLAAAVAASFAAQYDIPTVGASGLIFAMLGCAAAAPFAFKHLAVKDWRKYTLFLLVISISIAATFFHPQANAAIHLASFAAAVPLCFLHRIFSGIGHIIKRHYLNKQ
jgi:membrane associated rhomboid family serine protease